MAIKTIHDTSYKKWFISFTCYKWIPLFQNTNSYDLVYNWLNLIKSKNQIETLAFVIMPNHVHLMLYFHTEHVDLNGMISNAKRFMAYEIVKRLKENNELALLQTLKGGCSQKEKLKGQKHKVFETSFDAKPIYSDHFLYQKLDYIHHNPVSGKWNLSTDFMEYPHSSAAFYELGTKHDLLNLIDFREIEENNNAGSSARDPA